MRKFSLTHTIKFIQLYHADEEVARQLIANITLQLEEEEPNVFPDTGWFQLSATRLPVAEELSHLSANVGDTSELGPPTSWEPVVDPTVVQLHNLSPGDPERNSVVNAFLSSQSPHVRVLSVKRIQNLAMYQSYVVKRQTVCIRELGKEKDAHSDEAKRKALQRFERRWLWHGTNKEVMFKIMQQGFNRSFCGKNATVYGKGVYFARDSSYSSSTAYSVPDQKGIQYMVRFVFLCNDDPYITHVSAN